MDPVVISVISGFFAFNLLGVALYHSQWKKEHKKGEWKCKEFAIWTACMFLFGICYCVARLFEWWRNRTQK